MEIPELDDAPELSLSQFDLLEAFVFLARKRPVWGLGQPGAIPGPEIESYCRMYGIKDVGYFSDLINNLDVKYLSLLSET